MIKKLHRCFYAFLILIFINKAFGLLWTAEDVLNDPEGYQRALLERRSLTFPIDDGGILFDDGNFEVNFPIDDGGILFDDGNFEVKVYHYHHDGNVTYWSSNTIYSQGDIVLVSVQSDQNNTEIIPYIYLKTGPSTESLLSINNELNSFVFVSTDWANLLEYVPSKIPSDLENGWTQDVTENVQIYFNKTYAPSEFDDGVQSLIENRYENGLFLSTDDSSEVLNFLFESEGNASSSKGYQEGVNNALEEINNNLADYGFRDADSVQNEIIDLLSTQQRNIKSFTQGWFFTQKLGWLFCTEKTYPYIYDATSNNWVLHGSSPSKSGLFYPNLGLVVESDESTISTFWDSLKTYYDRETIRAGFPVFERSIFTVADLSMEFLSELHDIHQTNHINSVLRIYSNQEFDYESFPAEKPQRINEWVLNWGNDLFKLLNKTYPNLAAVVKTQYSYYDYFPEDEFSDRISDPFNVISKFEELEVSATQKANILQAVNHNQPQLIFTHRNFTPFDAGFFYAKQNYLEFSLLEISSDTLQNEYDDYLKSTYDEGFENGRQHIHNLLEEKSGSLSINVGTNSFVHLSQNFFNELTSTSTSKPYINGWYYTSKDGWLWTNNEVFPFIYRNSDTSWLYFYGRDEGSLFYDYKNKSYVPLSE